MRQEQIQVPQIHQPNNSNSDAPQEEIERDMICGVRQMNRGTKTITLHSNQQHCKDKDPTKVIELYQN